MTQRANYTKLGAFVLAGTALLVAGLMVFGLREALRAGIDIETYFDESVQGLDVGSPVKYRGVKIGTVKNIGFAREFYTEAGGTQARYVIVRATLTSGFVGGTGRNFQDLLDEQVRDGMRIRLAPQGITGLSFLEIDYVSPESFPVLDVSWEPGTVYIPSARARFLALTESVEQVARELQDARIGNLAAKVDELLTSFNTAVKDARVNEVSNQVIAMLQEFRETNTSVNATIDRVSARMEAIDIERIPAELHAAIGDVRETVQSVRDAVDGSRERVGQLIDGLIDTASDGRALLNTANETLNSDEVGTAIRQFQAAAERVLDLSGDLPRTLDLINRNLRRIEMTLSAEQEDISVIIRNLYTITENLKNLTELANEYPSLLILGAPPIALEDAP